MGEVERHGSYHADNDGSRRHDTADSRRLVKTEPDFSHGARWQLLCVAALLKLGIVAVTFVTSTRLL
jgi:hypothetical protein